MYLNDRKSNGTKAKASPGGSERNSPSALTRDGSGSLLSNGGLNQASKALSSLNKFSSGRLSSQGVRSAAGSSAQAPPESRPAAGKPTRNSSPGEFKSHSFNGGSIFGSFKTPSSPGPASKARSAFPGLDLGASMTRRAAASSFKQAPTFTASMPTPSSRPRSTSTPAENIYVLDDLTFSFGHSSFQGQRDYQEDTVAVLTTPNSFLGGVFDGHGGDDVSKELERVLLQNINRRVAEALIRGPDDPRAVEGAMRLAYVSTNEEIAARLDKAQEAGSCAVTCMIKRVGGRAYLFSANAGDCRAVLCSQGASGPRRAIRLTEDHKPHPNVCPSEITRVCDAGGCVLWGRVQGCLAVSRAFGDRTLQPYVIADPHVDGRILDPDSDLFIYLASDGVTDMIDDQQGCMLIAEQFARGSNSAQAAAALVSAAYHKGSCDNISVLVIRIRRRQPGDVTTGAP